MKPRTRKQREQAEGRTRVRSSGQTRQAKQRSGWQVPHDEMASACGCVSTWAYVKPC